MSSVPRLGGKGVLTVREFTWLSIAVLLLETVDYERDSCVVGAAVFAAKELRPFCFSMSSNVKARQRN